VSPATREVIALSVRLLLALVIGSLVSAVIGYLARDQAEAVAHWFTETLGIVGLGLGTFVADGLFFPIPPQFYLFVAVAGGQGMAAPFLAIAAGSVAAGFFGHAVARRAAGWPFLARRFAPYQRVMSDLFERRGFHSALVASLLPVPYSMLCYVAGLASLPRSFVALLSLFRVPKLLGFLALIYLGWMRG